MRELRVMAVTFLLLAGGAVVASAAEPQVSPVCLTAATAERPSVVPPFFVQPEVLGSMTPDFPKRCRASCDPCNSSAECYIGDLYVGPCGVTCVQ